MTKEAQESIARTIMGKVRVESAIEELENIHALLMKHSRRMRTFSANDLRLRAAFDLMAERDKQLAKSLGAAIDQFTMEAILLEQKESCTCSRGATSNMGCPVHNVPLADPGMLEGIEERDL